MKKILIISSAVILFLVGVRFTITKIGEYQTSKIMKMRSVVSVKLDDIKETKMSKSIEIPGRIESMDRVDLIARIDGYLQKKHFHEGEYVKKGQILLTIEPTQYLNNLNHARANLETAKAKLYKTTRDYNRGKELVEKDFISKSTYDGLYADKLSASASVKAAQAQLSEAQRNYNYTQIKSPVDGKVGSLLIQEGNYVSQASGTLATVVKTNPIHVKYSVDSKQFEMLRNEDFIPNKNSEKIMVDLILPSGKLYNVQGIQDFYDNQISTTTGTIDFRATFKNDNQELIPGDFVKVKVYSNLENSVLVVPQDIVQQNASGKYVFVVDENSQVQERHFKDAGQYGKYWIIKEGLKKGDKYIATNITKLMPKMKVKVVNDKAASKEPEKVK